jgi:hypothetical protein
MVCVPITDHCSAVDSSMRVNVGVVITPLSHARTVPRR